MPGMVTPGKTDREPRAPVASRWSRRRTTFGRQVLAPGHLG